MEGESRKRKMENEEDEDEEEEMEKFFALVRSAKDVRERLNKLQEGEKKKDEGEKPVGVWNPSFQLEDFMEGDVKSEGTPQASLAGPSKREDETKEEHHEEGGGGDRLDLNLSL